MKFISKRNIIVSLIALIIGICAVAGLGKVFHRSSVSVSGKVTTFILNPEGRVDGAILDTGDQVHFGMETGEIVTGQVKIGDTLTATGHAGTKSDYGRELRAESLQIGDQTITVLHSKPKPPRGGKGDDKPKRRPGDDRRPKPRPGDDKMPPPPPPPAKDGDAPKPDDMDEADVPPPPAPAQPELQAAAAANANGQVQFVLVGGRGEARGLILSGGEQIDLPREVVDAGLTFTQETQVSVEGEFAQSDFGKFIRPARITIGNQTFSFNR